MYWREIKDQHGCQRLNCDYVQEANWDLLRLEGVTTTVDLDAVNIKVFRDRLMNQGL